MITSSIISLFNIRNNLFHRIYLYISTDAILFHCLYRNISHVAPAKLQILSQKSVPEAKKLPSEPQNITFLKAIYL